MFMLVYVLLLVLVWAQWLEIEEIGIGEESVVSRK